MPKPLNTLLKQLNPWKHVIVEQIDAETICKGAQMKCQIHAENIQKLRIYARPLQKPSNTIKNDVQSTPKPVKTLQVIHVDSETLQNHTT